MVANMAESLIYALSVLESERQTPATGLGRDTRGADLRLRKARVAKSEDQIQKYPPPGREKKDRRFSIDYHEPDLWRDTWSGVSQTAMNS